MPSHTASIAKTYPKLVACVNKDWRIYGAEPAPGALDPTKDQTYSLIEDIVAELAEIFPDTFYHAGGDEVNTNCWKDDPTVGAYLKKHAITVDQLWAKFEDKRAIIWEDAIVQAKANLSKSEYCTLVPVMTCFFDSQALVRHVIRCCGSGVDNCS
jgi:hexosaminidase